jgi:hypothetical protein
MLGRLRRVNEFYTNTKKKNESVYKSVVDKLLNGIVNSSSVAELRFLALGGPSAFFDFAMRFQSSLDCLSIGLAEN